MPPQPYVLDGRILESDSSTGAKAITVYIKNETNLQIGEVNTGPDGRFVYDLQNITYSNGDKIKVYVRPSGFKEGQELVNWLARKVTKEITANWTNIKDFMFAPNIANNNPMPYDDTHNLFRRTMTIQFKGMNVGEAK